ncbi:peptidoglycan-binding domain-containing protein [Enterobacter cloacae]|uniref:peptidoglycan-binding domain-containing protein n=2 Tax=Enterobacter cloacae TaxID=550 RepID=UPI00254BF71D|nr:peptidoglycan-binding domain-containing protein [Enterobacter cloacae]
MDKLNIFYTTRHRLIWHSLISALINEPWLVLHGAKGSGKSLLAGGIIDAWAHRTLTIGSLARKGYQLEWIVLADSQTEGSLTGRVFSSGTLWSGLLGLMGERKDSIPLFVLEDGQRIGNRLVSTVQDFVAIMPKARLLLTGTFHRRQQRHLRKLHPLWFEIPNPDEVDCLEVIAAHADVEPEESGVLAEHFVRKIMRRCRGNLHLVARTGEFIRRNKEGKQKAVVGMALQQAALRSIPVTHHPGGTCLALIVVAALCGTAGRYFSQPLSRWLPQPERLLSVATTRPISPPLTLTSKIMSTNESLALLYNVWGFDVDKGEAWCDQAYRAGMACISGNDALEALLFQGLPWIATLKVENILLPVVVIGGGDKTLTVLSGSNTWIVDKSWFGTVWTGSSTRMWKPSPEGNASITRKSTPDDIIWLDTMLSRLLSVEAEGTGEWSPLLTEKVRQFQTQHKIKADGVMGQLSLIRLWQALGESPKLNQDGDTI